MCKETAKLKKVLFLSKKSWMMYKMSSIILVYIPPNMNKSVVGIHREYIKIVNVMPNKARRNFLLSVSDI